MTSFDIIVIGAGHNGMTTATVLAKTGRKVLVVEAADTVGGMCRTAELAPGFLVSPVAHILNRLDRRVVKTLALGRHGLKAAKSATPTVCLSGSGDHLTLTGAYGQHVDGLSGDDAAIWQALRKRLLFQAGLLGRFNSETPAQPGAAVSSQKFTAVKAALRLKLAGTTELREFLRMVLMCVADVADERLQDDRIKGLLAFDATLGTSLGPRSPTSLLGLYQRLTGEIDAMQYVPLGGMGAVMSAFHDAAKSAGVTFSLSTKVTGLVINQDRVTGITTSDGKDYAAPCIVSAINPATTFLDLVGPQNLDTDFVRDLRTIRCKGNVSRINLALDSAPDFAGLDPAKLGARMVCASSINQVETGFNPSKYGELPDVPTFEMILPSVTDKTMAPDGAATLSIAVQNTPYDLKSGWKTGRKKLEKSVMARLEKIAPGIGKSVIASQVLTPVDIETQYHAPGGHWHHGELQVDRLHALRPVFGAAHYRAPIDGLYITGAGTHPGGGVSGLPGLNAAREVIADDTGAKS